MENDKAKTYLDIKKQLKGNYILVSDDTSIDELREIILTRIKNHSFYSSRLSSKMMKIYHDDYNLIKKIMEDQKDKK